MFALRKLYKKKAPLKKKNLKKLFFLFTKKIQLLDLENVQYNSWSGKWKGFQTLSMS